MVKQQNVVSKPSHNEGNESNTEYYDKVKSKTYDIEGNESNEKHYNVI